ncbi:MAG TPA: DUF2877 domain-containing protein [Burkholderiaceae bacterium]|nr:DUF2877 domain-containing protein [Burkholderiaceae bacterium]
MQMHSQPTQAAHRPEAAPPTAELEVGVVGYLVPKSRNAWRVHSVFANACNFSCDDGLVTLVAPRSGRGPTLLSLRRSPPRRLESLFTVGEVLSWLAMTLRTARVALRFDAADIWSPPAPRTHTMPMQIEANLAVAFERLAFGRQQRPGVLDDRCAPVVDALVHATRRLDGKAALRAVGHLVGLGQGLTPAGDDFLVGLLAALDTFANDPARRTYRDLLRAAVRRLATRTTPIAAHYLCLAAAGHYLEVLVDVREAVLCATDRARLLDAVDAALGLGATSGADMLSGLLHTIEAWLPGATVIEH